MNAIFRACARYVATVFAASVAIFVVLRIIPGDPAEIALGVNATEELLAKKRAELGTDRPLVVQYADWLNRMLHGDFGTSLTSGKDISPVVWDRLQVSLIVVCAAMALSLAIAIPMGVWAARRKNHLDGHIITAGSQLGVAVPSFLAGVLLVTVFAVHLGWLPANGWVPPGVDFGAFAARLVLPVVALSAVQGAIMTRYVRSSVVEIMNEDFMRTARATGLTTTGALIRHGLKNAALPVITVTGIQLAGLVIGAVVIERVFVIPGLGSMLLDSVTVRDLPTIQSIVMILVVFTLGVNLLVDLTYALLDPRIRK